MNISVISNTQTRYVLELKTNLSGKVLSAYYLDRGKRVNITIYAIDVLSGIVSVVINIKEGEFPYRVLVDKKTATSGVITSSPSAVDAAEYFETVSKNLKSYPAAFVYGGNGLSTITYNLGGGDSIVKTFNYTLGVLTSIVLSGDTPNGISLTKTFEYTDENLTSITYS